MTCIPSPSVTFCLVNHSQWLKAVFESCHPSICRTLIERIQRVLPAAIGRPGIQLDFVMFRPAAGEMKVLVKDMNTPAELAQRLLIADATRRQISLLLSLFEPEKTIVQIQVAY